MLPNFVLIGFMGCGKSSVGRRLSSLTGHRFVDSDELVVKADGRSIPEIFASCGEEGFREIEQRVLADLVGVAGMVLSSGGGAILRQANREVLKKIGIVVWLDSDPSILFDRAIRSGKRLILERHLISSSRQEGPSTNRLRISASTRPMSIKTRLPERCLNRRCAFSPRDPEAGSG